MEVEHPPLPSPMEQQPVPQPEPENSVNSDTAAPPSLLDFHTNVVQGVRSLGFVREQTQPEPMSINEEPASISKEPASPSLPTIHTKAVHAIRSLGFDCNENTFDLQKSLVQCVPELNVRVPPGSDPPTIRSSSNKSWMKNYSALSFLMNGQLFAEYERVSNMLGIPSCSKNQWLRIVDWTEKHVTKLAVVM